MQAEKASAVSRIATWAWFISVGVVGAKAVALLAQYAVFRAIVRRRLSLSLDRTGAGAVSGR